MALSVKQFFVVGLLSFGGLVEVNGLQCYYADTGINQKTLPTNASILTCSKPAASCAKSYTFFQTADNSGNPVYVEGIHWGCTDDIGGLNDWVPCGNLYETTWGGPFMNATYINYQRKCTCCGDLCNDAKMDAECNEPYKGTKPCYTYGQLEINYSGQLPEWVPTVNCTETQTCFKQSFFDGYQSQYTWGCTNLPTLNCDGSACYSEELKGTTTVNLCCGELCNSASMDGIIGNSSSCGNVEPTTSTTHQPAANHDHTTALIVAGLLGGLLFVALIVIGVLGFLVYRLRKSQASLGLIEMGRDVDNN